MAKRKTRNWMITGVILLLVAVLTFAFWPRAMKVDMSVVRYAPLQITIDEEAKTRVRDAYVVSAPVAGRIRRVDVEPGDHVVGGETRIAHMLPLNPSALDTRTREQARASVSAAEAAVRVARADLNKAIADRDLADLDLKRARKLHEQGTVTQATLDRAEQVWRSSRAAFDTASAAISMREAELANARAHLISFSETPPPGNVQTSFDEAIPLTAPVTGSILRIMQKSETTLAAGTPILEIGDISNDLEVVVELLSTDAVKVAPGNRVIIEKWGKPYALNGVVERVEPWGFTKYSALGVEEQRVNAIIQFSDPLERRQSLGHGYRVETRIVVWETDSALVIPANALFREGGQWAVFKVVNGRAVFSPVETGNSNGVETQITQGLEENDVVILYPGAGLVDRARVERRTVE